MTDSATLAELAARIRRGEAQAFDDFYATLRTDFRHMVRDGIGLADAEDHIHDAYLVIVRAIQGGSVIQAEALAGFIATVLRRRMGRALAAESRSRHDDRDESAAVEQRAGPEDAAVAAEKRQLMIAVLEELSPRDREILTRFYLHNEAWQDICRDMNLTETQFRVTKWRAKARFARLGQRRLKDVRPLSLRRTTTEGSVA